MRKLFSLFVALLTTIPLWAYDFQSGDLYYSIISDSKYVTVAKSNTYHMSNIIIPSTVEYEGKTYVVTSIEDEAFSWNTSLTSVFIPNSITSIGYAAFYGCQSLSSITIVPNDVLHISQNVFYNTATYNDETNWEDGVLYISNCVIDTKKCLEGYYKIKENTHTIAEMGFSGNTSLVSITMPNTMKSIGSAAFSGCSNLTSITIPNSVSYIGMYAFESTDWYKNYPEEVLYINDILYKCNSDKFTDTSISIKEGTVTICPYAFEGCISLDSITIPSSITNIGLGAFSSCYNVTSIVVESDNDMYDSRENCNAIIETATNTLIAGCQNTIIPNTITSIAGVAFEGCFGLTSMTIPNSVTSIEDGAFRGCLGMKSITIPSSVTNMGNYVFEYCHSLLSISIPNSVTNIGIGAFSDCSSLVSVTIPNSVTGIEDRAFIRCSSLSSIVIPYNVMSIGVDVFEGTGIYNNESNWDNDVLYINDCLIRAKESLTGNYVIKETTRLLAESAFRNCSSLTSITIPSGVAITYGAFFGCSSLTSVTLNSDSIVNNTIGLSNLFGSQVKEYVIGNSVTSIGYCAFHSCTSLTSVTIPNSVTSIGSSAFYNTGIYNDVSNWENDVLYIDNCLINAKTSISGAYTIKENTRLIADNAFSYFSYLTSITCLAMMPPILGEDVFYGCENPTLFVPCEALEAYQTHEQWGQFTNIQCIASEEVETDDVIITPSTTSVTITWPTAENAYYYVIEIKKDGEVFCTLTFNADGQLLNIAFAPARDGNNHPALYAEQVANGSGLRFTVTGLEEGTNYTYNVVATDQQEKEISSYSGEFTTQSSTPTNLENVDSQSPTSDVQKIMHNGQLIILRDGKTYNAMGQEL